jgi:hypothetical protein
MNRILTVLAALAALLVAVPAQAASATVTRAWQYKDASAAGLELDNLIGDVRVEKGNSAGFYVSVRVIAEADTAGEADALAQAVEFRSRDSGGSSLFQVKFPETHFAKIYLPGAPASWWSGRMYVKYLGERRDLTGDPEKGARIRVDVVVRVPEGGRLTARNKFGDTMSEGVAGDVTLDGTRGRVSSSNGTGKLTVDTGSGRIDVATHEGEVNADTGSGGIDIANCKCRINADTGSGGIRVVDSEGELVADAGSGSVTVRHFAGSVRADTGSGSVKIEGLSNATELVADTGSGSVHVAGDLSHLEEMKIDTGSGSVSIEAFAWPSMAVTVDTSSGSVAVDVTDAEVTRRDGRERIVLIGGAAGRGLIDTGSGSVRLRTVAAPAE